MKDLIKQNVQVPTSEEQTIQLLSLLSEIIKYEEQMKKAKKALSKKYNEVEKKIRIYYEAQLAIDKDYTLESDFGRLSKSNKKKWVYEDEKSIINQLEALYPELVKTTKSIDKVKFKEQVMVSDDGTILMETDGGIEVINNVTAKKEESISIKPK